MYTFHVRIFTRYIITSVAHNFIKACTVDNLNDLSLSVLEFLKDDIWSS